MDEIHRAERAKNLLENDLFTEAFARVADELEMQALDCDPDNQSKAQRIIIAKQLLQMVKRELYRVVEDGEVAKINLKEMENQGILKKFVR